MTWRKSAALISHMGMRLMMPALLTRMLMGPTSADLGHHCVDGVLVADVADL